MDCHSKDWLIVNQFLMRMDNLSFEVLAHGHRQVEGFLRIASSPDAVTETTDIAVMVAILP